MNLFKFGEVHQLHNQSDVVHAWKVLVLLQMKVRELMTMMTTVKKKVVWIELVI